MARKTPHHILSGFLIMFVLAGLGCGNGVSKFVELFSEQKTGPTPTPGVGRDVSPDYLHRLLWRKDNIYMLHDSYPSPGLLVSEGHLAFINFLGGSISEVNQLTVLDGMEGTVLWQSERFGDLEDVAIKEGNAFVLLRKGNPLNIYEINGDSKPVSTFNYFDEYVKFYTTAVPDSDLIYTYYRSDQHNNELFIRTIDSTETITATKNIQAQTTFSRPFVLSHAFAFLTGKEYTGIDLKTGESLWRTLSLGQIDSWPVLWDDSLIVVPGDGKRYMLLSLDMKNGHELWRTEKEFSSAIALCRNDLFVLRNDAALVRLDPTTGHVKEEIAFTPASIDAGASAYWLACDEQRLFVYFGDSQELFALEL